LSHRTLILIANPLRLIPLIFPFNVLQASTKTRMTGFSHIATRATRRDRALFVNSL